LCELLISTIKLTLSVNNKSRFFLKKFGWIDFG
jgi:hypothetical protein